MQTQRMAMAPHKWLVAVGFGLGALLGGCSPDRDITPPDATCQPPPFPENVYGEYWIRRKDWSFYYPVINPANPQQYGLDGRAPKANGHSFQLYGPGVVDSSQFRLTEIWLPSWSRRGWIAKADYNGFLWLVKANGDSLTSLRNLQTGYCQNPQWLPDGVHLLYGQETLSTMNAALYRLNTKTMVSEQVSGNYYMPFYYSPSPDGQQIASFDAPASLPRGLWLYSLITHERRLLASLPENEAGKTGMSNYAQASWAWDANVIFWTGDCSLYRTDPVTGATIKLRDGCINNSYEQVAAAPDGSFVIATKYEQRYLGNDSLETSSTAWKIAGDGSWEERLPRR